MELLKYTNSFSTLGTALLALYIATYLVRRAQQDADAKLVSTMLRRLSSARIGVLELALGIGVFAHFGYFLWRLVTLSDLAREDLIHAVISSIGIAALISEALARRAILATEKNLVLIGQAFGAILQLQRDMHDTYLQQHEVSSRTLHAIDRIVDLISAQPMPEILEPHPKRSA